MKKQISLVKEFHEKFRALVSESPSLISEDRSNNRHRLMKDEVEEYLIGVQQGDVENIAKELADILYNGLRNHLRTRSTRQNRSNIGRSSQVKYE